MIHLQREGQLAHPSQHARLCDGASLPLDSLHSPVQVASLAVGHDETELAGGFVDERVMVPANVRQSGLKLGLGLEVGLGVCFGFDVRVGFRSKCRFAFGISFWFVLG